MTDLPARAEGIELEEVEEGYLALDPGRERVHYLNHTAVMVLELCTGERDLEEIARVLQKRYDLHEPPYADVRACLAALSAEGLVIRHASR